MSSFTEREIKAWPALGDGTPEEHREGCIAHGRRIADVGAVERCLKRHLDVEEIGICPRPTIRGERALVAHVIMKENRPFTSETIEEIRSIADNNLPAWARPSRYRQVIWLPRFPDGRVDHAKLLRTGFRKMEQGFRPTPKDRKKSNFVDPDIPAIEVYDPVNFVTFEGVLCEIQTWHMWKSTSLVFKLRHLENGRRRVGAFWADSTPIIRKLESLARGAHVVIEGRIRSLVNSREGMGVCLIECTSIEEVQKSGYVPLGNMNALLEALL